MGISPYEQNLVGLRHFLPMDFDISQTFPDAKIWAPIIFSVVKLPTSCTAYFLTYDAAVLPGRRRSSDPACFRLVTWLITWQVGRLRLRRNTSLTASVNVCVLPIAERQLWENQRNWIQAKESVTKACASEIMTTILYTNVIYNKKAICQSTYWDCLLIPVMHL